MHQARTKKQETIRQIVTYGLLPILIITSVFLITMYIDGYRYDMEKRVIEQGGLIQVMSQPTGATVTYDGETLNNRTNMRIDATAGTHTITLNRDGYKSWQKTITVEPGRVLWLNYSLLIPRDITTKSLASYKTLDDSLSVYGQNKLVLLENAANPVVTTLALDGETLDSESVTIPSDLYNSSDDSVRFQLISTDPDGRHVILKASGRQTEWLVLDLDDSSASRNLTTIVNESISSATFSQADSQDIYVVAKSALRRVDFAERVISAPLVTGIVNYYQASDGTLSYIATDASDDSQLVAGYYTAGASSSRVYKKHVADSDDRENVRFLIDTYDDAYFAVLQNDLNLEIENLSIPASDSSAELSAKTIETVTMQKHVDSVGFSPKARFVIAQAGADSTTYDLELDAVKTFSLQGNAKTNEPLSWVDNYHVWSGRDGSLTLYEFDGNNAQVIGDIAENQDIVLSKNKRALYFFQVSDDGQLSLRYLKLS